MRAPLVRVLAAAAAAGCLLAGAAGAAGGAGAAPPAAAAQQATGELVLPAPVGTIPVPSEVFRDRPERLRTSSVPGRIRDREQIDVRVAPDGTPVGIEMVQRIDLLGTGDYVIRVRGSAVDAQALDGTPAPVLQRSAVVWQGFVPGRRSLAARITLDPLFEAPRLPVEVALEWTGAGRIGADGTVPGDGRLVVRLRNTTARPDRLPTGVAPAAALAGPLDALRAYAERRDAEPPPMAGRGLPERIPAEQVGAQDAFSYAPMRVTGRVVVAGADVTVTGPGTTARPGGAEVAGVLADTTEFALDVRRGGRLELDLTVVPALDPRLLVPPTGATWAEWAATGPDRAARRAATELLVATASSAARADEYVPYFGHHGPGDVSTTFRYRLAEPVYVRPPRPPLRPRPVPIALTALGLVALSGGAVVAWRRL